MEVKGTAVKTIPEFIRAKHPDKLESWLNSLPEKSRKYFIQGISASAWYPLKDAGIIPTKLLSETIYGNIKEGSWNCGRYSADAALTGIYKIYVKMSSPGHIIDRASRIIQAYYQPSEVIATGYIGKNVQVHLIKFPEIDKVIEYRIAGWMERALELSGCKNVQVNIAKSLTAGDSKTEFHMKWD